MHKPAGVFISLACLALAACGGTTSAPAESGGSAPPAAPVATAPTQADPAPAAEPSTQDDTAAMLSGADIDAYVQGMRKELELLSAIRDKADQARAAKDIEAEAMAMMEGASGDIDRAGASASGLDPSRYGFVKNTIDTLIMTTALKASAGGSAGEMFDQRAQEAYTHFEPDAAEAMKSRLAELTRLHDDVLAARVRITG